MRKSKLFSLPFKLIAVSIVCFLIIGMVNLKDLCSTQDVNSQIESYNYAVGTQTIGSKYKFTNETMLVETALEIEKMGSNL